MTANQTSAANHASTVADTSEESFVKLDGAFGQLNQAMSLVRSSVEGVAPAVKGATSVFAAIPDGLMAVGVRIKDAVGSLSNTLDSGATHVISDFGATVVDSLRNAVPKSGILPPQIGQGLSTNAFASHRSPVAPAGESGVFASASASTTAAPAPTGGIGSLIGGALGGLGALAGKIGAVAGASGAALHGMMQLVDVMTGMVGKANPALLKTFTGIMTEMQGVLVLGNVLVPIFTVVVDVARTATNVVAGIVGPIGQAIDMVMQAAAPIATVMGLNFLGIGVPEATRDTRDSSDAQSNAAAQVTSIGSVNNVFQSAMTSAYGQGKGGPGPETRTATCAEEMNRKLGEVQTEISQFFKNLPAMLKHAFVKSIPGGETVSKVLDIATGGKGVAGSGVSTGSRTLDGVLSSMVPLPVSGVVASFDD